MYRKILGRRTLWLSALPVAAGVLWITAGALGQNGGYVPSTKKGDWPYYTADEKGSKYSPLDQINASNFSKMEPAWRFKTDNFGTRPEFKLEGTPLAVNGIWALSPGNVSPSNSDAAAAPAAQLYFTAVPNHGGLFGYLTAVPAELTEGNAQ